MKERQPGMIDYIKAAFNFKVPVRGVGGLPVNWLYMGLVGGMAFVAWPFALIGGAIEMTYLIAMISNPNFQRVIRSQQNDNNKMSKFEKMDEIFSELEYQQKRQSSNFNAQCKNILDIVKNLVGEKDPLGILKSYQDNLMELRMIYINLLTMISNLEKSSNPESINDIMKKLEMYQREIDSLSPDCPADRRSSLQGTIDIMKRRIEMISQLENKLNVANLELRRLDEQILLIKDQALLSNDSSVISMNLDATTSVIETHSEWVRENQILIQ